MNDDKCHKLVELISSCENLLELESLMKTMDQIVPIKYRMLKEKTEIDKGIGGMI